VLDKVQHLSGARSGISKNLTGVSAYIFYVGLRWL